MEYIDDTLIGDRFAVIDDTDAMAIKMIAPDNILINSYGPFEDVNLHDFRVCLDVDLDNPPKWHLTDRKCAKDVLLSRPLNLC